VASGSRTARTVLGRPVWQALIVAEKGVGALAAGAGSLAALWMRAAGRPEFLRGLMRGALLDDPDNLVLRYLVRLIPAIAPGLALRLAVGLGVLAVLLAVEAVGFWYERPWAELLIIVETAALLPAEVFDLTRHLRAPAVVTLVLNVLILLYVAHRYRKSHPRGEQPS
jgi:uncharacterized membrane protein (DUF2068 family)